MGSGTLVAGGRRRARLYWWTAALVLPLVDPPVLALMSTSDASGVPVLLGVLLIAFGNWLVLAWISEGVWTGSARRRRVGLGLALSVALAVACGVGEFIVTLLIVCSNQQCFS